MCRQKMNELTVVVIILVEKQKFAGNEVKKSDIVIVYIYIVYIYVLIVFNPLVITVVFVIANILL